MNIIVNMKDQHVEPLDAKKNDGTFQIAADRIYRIKTFAGMTCRQFAKTLGISHQSLSRIINGKMTSTPVIEIIEGLPESLRDLTPYLERMVQSTGRGSKRRN